MKRRISTKKNLQELNQYKIRFLKQKQFPSLPRPYEKTLQPVFHVGYLMFIRSKFLFLGLLKSLEEKDMYTLYSLLKSYWENIAAFGYYYLRISKMVEDGDEDGAFLLAVKMGLGGRGFPTKEMIERLGHKTEEYTLPNIMTMMDAVDKDIEKKSGSEGATLRDPYDEQIAEGGHTTYTGLNIGAKWSIDKKSQLPDVNRSWDNHEKGALINLAVLGCIIFFYYWDKFEKIKKTEAG